MSDGNNNMANMEAYVAQGSDVNGQLILLIFIAAILGLGKGGVPGFATIATAATVATAPVAVSGGLGFAVAMQVPILTMIDVYAAWLHSDSLDWPTVWILLPLSFVGMAIGQAIDKHMTDASARLMVGVILLSILALRVWRGVASTLCPCWVQRAKVKRKDSSRVMRDENTEKLNHAESGFETSSSLPPPRSAESIYNMATFGWACIVGIIGGAATMLTNSMGPILNVYLLSVRELSPTAYIGTRAIFFCFINMGKLPMRFASGTLGVPMLPLAAALGLVSVLGVYCAKPIMLSMSEGTFVKLELAVVAFAGLRLCWMGLHPS